jgi:hypothetical protein
MDEIMKYTLLILVSLISINGHSASYTWHYKSTVYNVEPTYLPDSIKFRVSSDGAYTKIDGGATEFVCQGAVLTYDGGQHAKGKSIEAENIKLIYSGLIAAMYSQKPVALYGTDDCKIKYIHLLK